VAATAWSGTRPFEFSMSDYPPFTLAGAGNVITPEMTGSSGNPVGFELERIAELDPEFVFIEATGYANVRAAYNSDRRPVFDAMQAFKGGDQQRWNVYMCVPVIWYFTNFDNMLAGAYHIGSVLYPERFADVDVARKSDEIYRNFVGAPVFDRMQGWFEKKGGCRLTGRAVLQAPSGG
jgi:iron complex transport system substrate-binding protein